MDDMLVEDSFDEIWIGKGVVPLENIVVGCSHGRYVVWLIREPSKLLARDDYFVSAGYLKGKDNTFSLV